MRRIFVPTPPKDNINCWIADGGEVRYYVPSKAGIWPSEKSRNTLSDLLRMVRDGSAKEVTEQDLEDHVVFD